MSFDLIIWSICQAIALFIVGYLIVKGITTIPEDLDKLYLRKLERRIEINKLTIENIELAKHLEEIEKVEPNEENI